MLNREIKKQIDAFNNLVKNAESATNESIELQSEWARYLCIVAAGLVENAIKELFGEYVREKTSAPASRYIVGSLSKIHNPKVEKFLEVASAFNPAWKDELKAFGEIDGKSDAINSIMGHRHLIAHGKYKDANISMVRIKNYFERSVELLEFLETLLTQ